MDGRFVWFPGIALLVAGCANGRSRVPPDGGSGAPGEGDGAVVAPVLGANVSSADLGSVTVGASSAPAAVVIANGGTEPTGPLAATIGGAQASFFALGHDGCSGQRLAGGATCGIDVTFSPAAAGAAAGVLTVSANPGGAVTVSLAGLASAAGSLSISPASMTFAPLVDGMTTAPTTFTVTSNGSPASMIVVSLTGTGAAEFQLTSDACTGEALAPDGACTVELAFAPASVGPISASLAATSSNGTASAALTGAGLEAGVPPKLAWSESSYDAGTTATSTTTTLVLDNTGSVAAGPPVFTASGTNANDVAFGATTCDAGVQAAMSCTVAVIFTPSTTGPESATLYAQSDPGGVAETTLTGSGIPP